MNRLISIIVALSIIVAFAACQRLEPSPIDEVTVTTVLPSEFLPRVKFANHEVTLTSQFMKVTSITNSSGVATIEGLIPDEYSVSAKWEMNGAEFKQITTGYEYLDDNAKVVVTGSLGQQRIFSAQNVVLNLRAIISKSLVISKIYYSGTKDRLGKNYIVDQYIEIFNMSDKVEYIDKLYLGLTEFVSTPAFLPKDNPDSLHFRQICQFPGNGTDFPLQPNRSVVIAARQAFNHTLNADSTANLEDADFEAKFYDSEGNPAIKSIPIVYGSTAVAIKFFNLTVSGNNSIVLFDMKGEDISKISPKLPPSGKGSEKYLPIPTSSVLDGVECLQNKSNVGPDVSSKRLHLFIDAGYTRINSSSGYTHEALYRKVISYEDGKLDLQYTANSSNDFVRTTDPTPRRYGDIDLPR